MTVILNLTQHQATPAQVEAGVTDITSWYREALVKALTFDTMPTRAEVLGRGDRIAALAKLYASQIHVHGHKAMRKVMIGGAPFLMGALENALLAQDLLPIYAFSVRESVESTDSAGVVTKTGVFKHLGFVEA